MPPDMSITTASGIADLVPLDGLPRSMARTFVDGRSAFVVNRHDESPGARLLRPAGAVRGRAGPAPGGHRRLRIVQRTPVFGQVRLFTERRVVVDGQAWTDRPTAGALLTALRGLCGQ